MSDISHTQPADQYARYSRHYVSAMYSSVVRGDRDSAPRLFAGVGWNTSNMGRQVRYKNHPDDLAALWTYLESVDGVVLGQPTATPEPHVSNTLDLFEVGDLGQRRETLIARRQDLSSLRYKFYETRNFWLIDKLNSPVVEYSPGYDPHAQPFGRDDPRCGRMWSPRRTSKPASLCQLRRSS